MLLPPISLSRWTLDVRCWSYCALIICRLLSLWTRAFFEQERSFPLSQKIVRQIYERMDAWPAGLRLLARELDIFTSEEDIELMLSSFTGDYWSVREYFLSPGPASSTFSK
jgi:hypothetical protein